jgi:hypothetical protein
MAGKTIAISGKIMPITGEITAISGKTMPISLTPPSGHGA